jgi:hypothetical protein
MKLIDVNRYPPLFTKKKKKKKVKELFCGFRQKLLSKHQRFRQESEKEEVVNVITKMW